MVVVEDSHGERFVSRRLASATRERLQVRGRQLAVPSWSRSARRRAAVRAEAAQVVYPSVERGGSARSRWAMKSPTPGSAVARAEAAQMWLPTWVPLAS